MGQIILKIAHPAFEFLAQGSTGDFQPYLDMLTDEFTFWYPCGTYRGKFIGREGRARMSAKCCDHIEAGDRRESYTSTRQAGREATEDG